MELFGLDLEALLYWHWWVLAGALFILEVLSMSFFFLWFGVSALLVGGLVCFMPELSWQAQFILWAGIATADIFAWRIYKKKNPSKIKTDEPNLNRRGDQYVGRTFTLEEAIENGFGKVKVDDSIWKVECSEDLAAGSKVKVTAVDGTVLQVEAAG